MQVLKTAPYITIRCHFPSNYPSCQLDLQLSNLSTQPTHFASCQLNPPPFFQVDMFPITVKTAFSGRTALCPKSAPPRKSLVFKPFSYTYFSTFDIKHTTSTCTLPANISTGCTFSISYPCLFIYFKSLASVAESQLT